MLREDHRTDVRFIHHAVDDDKGGFGIIGRDLGQRGGLAETGHDDRVVARLGQAAHRLFALRIGLQLDLGIAAAGFLGPLLGPGKGGFVERTVELAAEIEDDRGAVGQRAGGGNRQRRGSAHQMFQGGH